MRPLGTPPRPRAASRAGLPVGPDGDASAQATVDLGQGGVQVEGGGLLGSWGQPDGCGGHEDGLPCDGRDPVVSQTTGGFGTAGRLLLPSPPWSLTWV